MKTRRGGLKTSVIVTLLVMTFSAVTKLNHPLVILSFTCAADNINKKCLPLLGAFDLWPMTFKFIVTLPG